MTQKKISIPADLAKRLRQNYISPLRFLHAKLRELKTEKEVRQGRVAGHQPDYITLSQTSTKQEDGEVNKID